MEVSKGYLRLRFPRPLFNGNQKCLSLNLVDTPENRVAAEIQARRIELAILAGYFDPTLAIYKADHTATPKKQKVYSLLELWEKYTQFKSGQVQESTLVRDYSLIKKRIRALPTADINQAVMVRGHLLSIYSAETAKRTLKQINACCNWAVLSKLIESNPFKDLAKSIKTKRKDR
ncbi:Arm DNA-binding domain-containing protein [Nostoc sp. DedVER01b]|uniref:Arm DNA-binding domain-containing protein n=1 Tax=Nostoc sp. DedVER01b TaxID=3075404 RepID=UPI002AD416BA|nr:hypothetical protein [Nostoc sp. DedVER01b]MDZ8115589.1 hypothetical protein [Nostoc sp. DedVER01b]